MRVCLGSHTKIHQHDYGCQHEQPKLENVRRLAVVSADIVCRANNEIYDGRFSESHKHPASKPACIKVLPGLALPVQPRQSEHRLGGDVVVHGGEQQNRDRCVDEVIGLGTTFDVVLLPAPAVLCGCGFDR